jgi:predicted translin family RNA/ssDNA-binding protein
MADEAMQKRVLKLARRIDRLTSQVKTHLDNIDYGTVDPMADVAENLDYAEQQVKSAVELLGMVVELVKQFREAYKVPPAIEIKK